MVLVWGIRGQGPEEKLNRARNLFNKLGNENSQILIPSLALTEYLVPVRDGERAKIIAHLCERFHIVNFDVRASDIASRLIARTLPERKKGKPGERTLIKSDAIIVASARSAGATVFYSDDTRCREFASQVGMEARLLPDIPDSLFEEAEG